MEADQTGQQSHQIKRHSHVVTLLVQAGIAAHGPIEAMCDMHQYINHNFIEVIFDKPLVT